MKNSFFKIKDMIFSIISYGSLFIFKILILIVSYTKYIRRTFSFMKSIILILYYGGEQKYLSSKLSNKNCKQINHLAIIIEDNYDEHCFLKFISWIKFLKVKYLTIYDPFKNINDEKMSILKLKISNIFKNEVKLVDQLDEVQNLEKNKISEKIENKNQFSEENDKIGKNQIKITLKKESKYDYDNDNSDKINEYKTEFKILKNEIVSNNPNLENVNIVKNEKSFENKMSDTFSNEIEKNEIENNLNLCLDIDLNKVKIKNIQYDENNQSIIETNIKKLDENTEVLNLFFVDYEESNLNYIKDMFHKEDFSFLLNKHKTLKELMSCEQKLIQLRRKNEGYKKFTTIKQSIIFPEILLVQDYLNTVNLYGFPFSLLENCEIL